MNKKLILILFLALILRLISLNQSLWLDEAFQMLVVSENSLKSLFSNYFPTDFNPPLSYLINWLMVRIFGHSEIVLRLPSVIFGTLNVWLVYLFAEKMFGDKPFLPSAEGRKPVAKQQAGGVLKITNQKGLSVSDLAALFLATAPLHIYYSQEGRAYILACFLATWSMYEFWKILTPGVNKKRPGFVLPWRYILATTLMLYSHYMTWLLISVQAVVILSTMFFKKISPNPSLQKRGISPFNKGGLRGIFLSWTLIFIFLIPWLPTFFKQLKGGQGLAQTLPVWSSLGELSFKNLALFPIKFLIGRISIENNFIYGLVLLPILLLIAWLLIKSLSLITYRLSLISFLWLWLILPIALGAILSLKTPVFQYFRFLYVLPAFYLLLTYGISCHSGAPMNIGAIESPHKPSLFPKGILSLRQVQDCTWLRSRMTRTINFRILVIFIVLVINLISSSTYLFNPKFHREDWKGAVNFISQKRLNAPVVILEPVNAPFRLYNRALSGAGVPEFSQIQTVGYSEVEQIRYLPQIWLIKYSQPIFDPENTTEKKLKNFGFEEISKHHFRGITVKYMVNPRGLYKTK